MARRDWLTGLCLVCLCVCACERPRGKKFDPTKGRVTGIVYCADTGKPARFATVVLTVAPAADEMHDRVQQSPLPEVESATTDLNGAFTMEAVDPGRYYAFATQDGYLDPERGLDIDRIEALKSDREQVLEAFREWRDHPVEVTVAAQRTSDVTLQMERAAEIDGTVTYEDGSPAIGMHFKLYRKTEQGDWTSVGLSLYAEWALPEVSDCHGHFSVTNLPAGEYLVCTSLPVLDMSTAPQLCLGNTFRRKGAAIVNVAAGETVRGVNIEIPLTGLYTVSGVVTALEDGHPLARGTVRLLYADDRQIARETSVQQDDGSFRFAYVPAGSYILQVSNAGDQDSPSSPPGDADGAKQAPRTYMEKEMPLLVNDDMENVNVQLTESVADKTEEP